MIQYNLSYDSIYYLAITKIQKCHLQMGNVYDTGMSMTFSQILPLILCHIMENNLPG